MEPAEGSRPAAEEEDSWLRLGRFHTQEPKEEDDADDHCWIFLSSFRLRPRPFLVLCVFLFSVKGFYFCCLA